jgi:3-oxoadipate enol-lactonase
MKRVGELIRNTPVTGYVGCCQAIMKLDITDRIGAIRCPTIVIVGDQDVGTPVPMSETIHKTVTGSQLVVLKDASHLSNLEQTEAFNTALDRFLAAH